MSLAFITDSERWGEESLKLMVGSVVTQGSSLLVQHSTVVPTVELRVYFKSELVQVQLPVNSTVAQVRSCKLLAQLM